MSEQSNFFNSINRDRPYDAEYFAEYFAKFFTNGIFNNGLQVVVNEGMSVNLLEGIANINGYRYKNDSNKTLNITNADGILDRVDNIVIRLDLPNRKITAEIVQGEFSENAVAPKLVRDNATYDLRVAKINIPAGTTEITQDLIEDTRLIGLDCGNVICAVQTPDFTKILLQYETIWTTLIDTQTKEYSKITKEFVNNFNAWFQTVQDILDGDTAGHLLNLINTKADPPTYGTLILLTENWIKNANGQYEQDIKDNNITKDCLVTGYTDLNNAEKIPNRIITDSYNGGFKAITAESPTEDVVLNILIQRTNEGFKQKLHVLETIPFSENDKFYLELEDGTLETITNFTENENDTEKIIIKEKENAL